MRLDKFLKTVGIIKRRTLSKDLCDNGNVKVDNIVKKSSYEIKIGDNISISYYNNLINLKIIEIPPKQLKKEDIDKYIKII